MHRNYFVFERQVLFINTRVQGAVINRCFTHRRNELVIDYTAQSSGFLRIGLLPSLPYLLLEQARNIKEPSTRFFERLHGKKIEKLHITPYDKLVTVHCADYLLICRFYGTNPNVYLAAADGPVIESFKKTPNDQDLPDLTGGGKNITAIKLSDVDYLRCDQTAAEFFTTGAGGFNNTLTRELLYRAQIDAKVRLSGLFGGVGQFSGLEGLGVEANRAEWRPKTGFPR